MKSLSELLGEEREGRIVITDSGLGGLSICADLERRLRGVRTGHKIDLVYVNAWPDAGHGYNDLPDPAARVIVLDKALAAMMGFRPGLILIACNTLSVLYELTEFAKAAQVPIVGIIDEGVDLFDRTLRRDPPGTLILFGTRTTIESEEHLRRLVRRGIDARRVRAAACHGLARAIDKDPDAPSLSGLVDECVSQALAAGPPIEGNLYAGLVCTHYSFIADLFRRSLTRHSRGGVEILDPNERMVQSLVAGMETHSPDAPRPAITVKVVSKVELSEAQRHAVARRLEPISARTARALVAYTHVPKLF
jgi:glutamate racemase